jgi:hypothetical protein
MISQSQLQWKGIMFHKSVLFYLILAISASYTLTSTFVVCADTRLETDMPHDFEFAPEFRANVESGVFENRELGIKGSTVSIGGHVYQPYLYDVYIVQPFITGSLFNEKYSETGNLKAGFETKLGTISLQRPSQLWIQAEAKLAAEEGARFAAQQDNYRFGLELRQQSGRFGMAFGGGYTFRINEVNRKFDIGNIVDARFAGSYRLSHYFVLSAGLLYWGLEPNHFEDFRLTDQTALTAAQVGLRIKIVQALSFGGSVIIPVNTTTSPEETMSLCLILTILVLQRQHGVCQLEQAFNEF